MRTRTMVTAVAVALAVAAGSFAAVRTTQQTPTHLGVPAANLVLLRGVTAVSTGRFGFSRIGADGVALPDYAVPAGMALVITDVSWYTHVTVAAGAFGILSLKSTAGANQLFADPFIVTANGWVFGAQHLTSGFVVASGQKLQILFAPGGTTAGLDMTLHGYLVG